MYRWFIGNGRVDWLGLGGADDLRVGYYVTEAAAVVDRKLYEVTNEFNKRGYLGWGDDIDLTEVDELRRTKLEASKTWPNTGKTNLCFGSKGEIVFRDESNQEEGNRG